MRTTRRRSKGVPARLWTCSVIVRFGVDRRALFDRLVAGNDVVVIDVSETLFIDSTFLKNLVKAQRAARERANTVLLQVGIEPAVRRILEISNFLTHFDHVSSREEALAWAPPEARAV